MNRSLILSTLIFVSIVFTSIASVSRNSFPFASHSLKEIHMKMGKEDILLKEVDTTILIYKKLDNSSSVFRLVNGKCKDGFRVPTRFFNLVTTNDLLKEVPTKEVFEISRFIRHIGLHKEGVKLLQNYKEHNPDSMFSYVNLSLVLVWEGQIDRGIAVMEEGIKVAKSDNEYNKQRQNLVSTLIHGKRYERAIKESLILLKEPEKFNIYQVNYNLACAYSLVNKPKEAIACLEITAKDPETTPGKYQGRELLEKDTDFDNIRHLPEFQEVKKKFKY